LPADATRIEVTHLAEGLHPHLGGALFAQAEDGIE
jgi:hypothetical protein